MFTTIPIKVTIKVKEDIRSCYAKYVFLQGKINNVIASLVLLSLFELLTEITHFPTLSYTSANEISNSFVYLKNKKGTPFARSLPI